MSKHSTEYRRRNYHKNRVLKLGEEFEKLQLLIKSGNGTLLMQHRLDRVKRMIRQSYSAYRHGEKIEVGQSQSLEEILTSSKTQTKDFWQTMFDEEAAKRGSEQ